MRTAFKNILLRVPNVREVFARDNRRSRTAGGVETLRRPLYPDMAPPWTALPGDLTQCDRRESGHRSVDGSLRRGAVKDREVDDPALAREGEQEDAVARTGGS